MRPRIAPHTTGQGRDRGYTTEAIIAETFGFSPAEPREMAEGDPVLIRSVRRDGRILYDWGDALLVSAVAAPLARYDGGDPR